ncbi:MAG: M28 family peptidase [Bacteroidota bacterium]
MARLTFLILLFLVQEGPCNSAPQSQGPPQESTRYLNTLESLFDADQAYRSAEFFTRFWRIGGGPEFDTCVRFIETELTQLGFQQGQKRGNTKHYFVQEDMPRQKVWIPQDAVLSLEMPERRILHSYAQTPLLLCRNSFPTDRVAPLVHVKGGDSESDYEQVNVEGSIVLCDAPAAGVYRIAMSKGALGVISSHVPPHNVPDQHPDLIAEGSIPYDTTKKSFGLQISRRTAEELLTMMSYQQVKVRIEIQTSFALAPIKTLVAEIPGTSRPDERVVLVAHLDHYKPGANDNASGSATLLEILRSLSKGIEEGDLERPARTLTFLWVDEYQGTGFWMRSHQEALDKVQAAFVLDMVGGDPEKTGGVFRVERMPDPSAIWFRYPDQHSGWGTGSWDREKLFGSYLNDFYLSIVRERSRTSGWRTAHNVWEGGSDHDPFLWKGIPAILSWHYPDFAYHSSMDVIGNISPAEMKNAGVSVGAAAVMLAVSSEESARQVLRTVVEASILRMKSLEELALIELADGQVQGREMLAAVKKQEKEIIQAWSTWYRQAIESTGTIPAGEVSLEFSALVKKQAEEHQHRFDNLLTALGI